MWGFSHPSNGSFGRPAINYFNFSASSRGDSCQTIYQVNEIAVLLADDESSQKRHRRQGNAVHPRLAERSTQSPHGLGYRSKAQPAHHMRIRPQESLAVDQVARHRAQGHVEAGPRRHGFGTRHRLFREETLPDSVVVTPLCARAVQSDYPTADGLEESVGVSVESCYVHPHFFFVARIQLLEQGVQHHENDSGTHQRLLHAPRHGSQAWHRC
mmetsp:Transcript_18192/g.38010  ORF Transcript_18192/g.38010 Transcript_18192/m.38010 type:complete len:213 (-) Transcript_18192:2816-3454(-)